MEFDNRDTLKTSKANVKRWQSLMQRHAFNVTGIKTKSDRFPYTIKPMPLLRQCRIFTSKFAYPHFSIRSQQTKQRLIIEFRGTIRNCVAGKY